MIKDCIKCGESKKIDKSNFYAVKSNKDGFLNECIVCNKIAQKEYRKINSIEIYKRQKNNRLRDKQKTFNQSKKYRDSRKEIIAQKKKDYYIKNKEVINNKKYLIKKERIRTDSFFKFKNNVSALISVSFRNGEWKKNSKTSEILGCSYEELKDHLDETFFKNYGRVYNKEDKIHIDHIKPVSLAKNEHDFLKLNHFSNLQYLLAVDNLRKYNKVDFSIK
jgi:hypothetical protein